MADDEIDIVLGSAQESRTPGNPFSALEREAMLKPALESAGIPARILRIDDVGNYPKWAHKLIYEIIGTAEVTIYGSKDSSAVQACAGIGIRTETLEYLFPGIGPQDRLSSGHVRDLICADNPAWKKYVPPKIAEALMAEIGDGMTGVQIIKKTRGII